MEKIANDFPFFLFKNLILNKKSGKSEISNRNPAAAPERFKRKRRISQNFPVENSFQFPLERVRVRLSCQISADNLFRTIEKS